MQKLLNQISSPLELRKLKEQLPLYKELRQYIIEIAAAKEGHLGAAWCS